MKAVTWTTCRVSYVVTIGAIFACVLHPACSSTAQNIPMGTWRTHLSYHQINSVAIGDHMIFASGNHGVMILDKGDNSISTYSKINGLNGTAITYIGFDSQIKRLIVAYADGKFDVVNEKSEVIGFDPTRNSSVTGSKKINHINIANSIAYLATDYGVIVFDVGRLLIKETWRGLGDNGQVLNVFQSAILQDSIFLGTGNGVIAGSMNDNLQDFNNWKRFDTGEFNGPVQHVANFNNAVFSAVNTLGIFKYEDSQWIKTPFLQGLSFVSIQSSPANLFISETHGLFKLNANAELVQIEDASIKRPNFASESADGTIWIGDGIHGLVTNASGAFVSMVPNSPSLDQTFKLTYYNNTIYALPGGYSSNRTALGNPGIIDSFNDGSWTNEISTSKDPTSLVVDRNSGNTFISSFGYGVESRDAQNNSVVFNDTNSPLINTNPPGPFVNVTALVPGNNGVWIANYASPKPLHFVDAGHNWKSFSFLPEQSKYPLTLEVDLNGSVWMGLDPFRGGGITVFNENENESLILSDEVGSGGLPHNSVNELRVDRKGNVWVGTDLGVAYFNDPTSVFSGNVNAIKPIYDGRFLLRDDKVTAIAVDGGNRKWVGTERGLWLFSETGEEVIYNFTTENSPLLSNVIRDIEVNGQSGEVFIATAEGMLSFRSDATDSNGKFETVKVFPNPVTADFVGSIGISGLATDALVKITDVNGKLVWQTRANGGSASWNLQDVTGRRPATGIYIVFAVTDDGHDSAVAKIAFVD